MTDSSFLLCEPTVYAVRQHYEIVYITAEPGAAWAAAEGQQALVYLQGADPDADFAANRLAMTKSIETVQTGQVTFAARDSEYGGHSIKEGEILAMEDGKLAFVEKDLTKAVLKLTRSMAKKGAGFVTVIYGSDVSEDQAQAVYDLLRARLSDDVELNLVNGGQPVYYYIISVE